MSLTLVHPTYPPERLWQVVHRIVNGNMLCAMATTGEDGEPHVNTAFFSFDDDLTLYFLSHPDSSHARNIRRSSALAVAVFDDLQPWGAQQTGLQLFGRAEPATSVLEQAARQNYGVRFPLYTEFVEGRLEEGAPKPSFFELRFLAFRPSRIKIMSEVDFGDDVIVPATVTRS
jgi:uncharacterized protein YhbP (UPF0306 family)